MEEGRLLGKWRNETDKEGEGGIERGTWNSDEEVRETDERPTTKPQYRVKRHAIELFPELVMLL